MATKKITKNLITDLFQRLSKREAEILTRRFGLKEDIVAGKKPRQTLQEVGDHYGITRERVRQIENYTIKKIKKSQEFKKIFPELEGFVIQILKKYNGVAEYNFFLDRLVEAVGSKKKTKEGALLFRQMFIFILSTLLTDVVEEIKSDTKFKKAWKIKAVSMGFSQTAVDALIKVIKEEGEPTKTESINILFKRTPFYHDNQEKLSDEVIISLFCLSRELKKNIFNEWGLTSWGSVKLKTVDEKIYYTLKRANRPLHFSEITEMINKQKLDHFRVHGATVRNLLTGEDKYVLVGRGIYALKEWGAESGTVAELIEKALKTKGPMTKNEIVDEILKQRLVKEQTVVIGLADKTKFKRLPSGKYKLVS